ncbi:MAG: cysteine--tRNA ligase [Deltaproteobacteria bacterium]|nr:MAG: cysteine--tRNA ligase [Deltaproteobacteria bacterium]
MSLIVFNTLGNRKEPFEPLEEGKVRMYVCGVTVYDLCHLGHARANMVFDFIYRYLLHSGFDVTYVRNFTDIDDKIIKRANEEGVDFRVISERYIQAFYEDMGRLGLLSPTFEPKATEHIDGIIELVSRLIERGHAYVVDGDVYFAIDTFPDYGKLSGKNLEELEAGARVDVDERKRNPLDFALWKKSKPGEPSWESPWGPGRPGWHIECSVMSMKHLGDSFDIHGGGKDLVFPHHENEIAQSECATGKIFARYWIHNGFVNIDKEKMSKSLGNIFTIREILEKIHPEVLRFFFAGTHYRSPIDYSDRSIREAKAGLDRIYTFYDRFLRAEEKAPELKEEETASGSVEEEDETALLTLEERFRAAMDDDFNTAAAMGFLFDAIRRLNRYYREDPAQDPESSAFFLKGGEKVTSLLRVLGFLSDDPVSYFRYGIEGKLKEKGISLDRVLDMVREREEARKVKDFTRADAIRDTLKSWGIILEDTPSGTFWKFEEEG